ncbi:MAG TPA: GDSL-type esterase/lipase family protein [Stellaceae bacterium]|nr:GDSL-type esterase/lipase family protein [Stellaceae bacterium]
MALPALWVAACAAMLFAPQPLMAQTVLRCAPFTAAQIAAPEPREARWPVHRFEQINEAVKTRPHRVLLLGDSLTERFPHDAPQVWRDKMVPRGVLNAGVSGDRTEHLLWRMQHGNLAGPAPRVAVLLIGTNDLGHGRAPEEVAEGIRADLFYLRQRLPRTRILLLGLWPRAESPEARLRRDTVAVNRLIQHCGDDRTIVYADLGGVLLDPDGRLSREMSPDLLHFSEAGYARLAPRLNALIDDLVAAR